MNRDQMSVLQRAFDISQRMITGEEMSRDRIAIDYRVTKRQAYRILNDMKATMPLTETERNGRTLYSLGKAAPAYSTGEALKENGREAVAKNNRLFIEHMRSSAIAYLKQSPYNTMTVDRLRKLARALGMKPNHPNAWGAIFRGKDFVRIGYRPSQETSNHRRVVSVWKLNTE